MFNATPRVISGTPTAIGSGTIRIRATNSQGSDDWTVDYTVRAPSVIIRVSLEIDFDNDGTYGHAAADVTGDLVKRSLRATRGRTLQSRRRANAGRLQCRLWNRNGKYDPINSSEPHLTERDISGIPIRFRIDGVTVWAGLLDDIRYVNSLVPYVEIIALGRLSTLRQPVSVAAQSGADIGDIAVLVGDAAGIDTTHLDGDKTLSRWPGVKDQDALLVLHDLEETEEGFLYERGDGLVAMEAEDARSTGNSAVSAMTLTDTITAVSDIPLLRGTAQDWGFRQIANVVRVPVETLTESGVITLWTSAQDIVLPAGGSTELLLEYPNAGSPTTHRGAGSWVAPVAGTDYQAGIGLTVSGAVAGRPLPGHDHQHVDRLNHHIGGRPGSARHGVGGRRPGVRRSEGHDKHRGVRRA